MRYLAIDYGAKRTGLAVCDASEMLASPLDVLETDKSLPDRILQIVKKEDIGAIVIGLPLNMDDTVGPAAIRVQQFGRQLEKLLTIPVYFQDERLTSFSAEEKIAAAELTRKKKKHRLDAIAAAEILQAFLEYKHSQ